MKTKLISKTLFAVVIVASVCSCKVVTYTQTQTLKEPSQEVIGNEFNDMIGLTKNQILQAMSTPKRTETDGAGGEILVYEDIKYVSNSSESYSARSNSYGTTDSYAESGTVGRSAGYGVAVGQSAAVGYNDGTVAAGKAGYVGEAGYVGASASYSAGSASSVSQNTSSTNTHRQAQSVSGEVKKYVNFFINAEGKCYNVKANYGDKYKTIPGVYQNCTYKKKKYSPAGYILWVCPVAGLIYTICALKGNEPKLVNCGNPYQK